MRGKWGSLLTTTALTGVVLLASSSVGWTQPLTVEVTSNNPPITYLGSAAEDARNDLIAKLSDFGTESFEDETNDVINGFFDNVLEFENQDGTFVIADVSDLPADFDIRSANFENRYAVDGEKYIDTGHEGSDANGQSMMTLDFRDLISAFAFLGTDIGDAGAQLSIRVTSTGGTTTYDVGHSTGVAASGNLVHFEILEEGISKIEFLGSGDNADGMGFDLMLAGNALPDTGGDNVVPEPATLTLLGAGLLGLGAARRRRRAK